MHLKGTVRALIFIALVSACKNEKKQFIAGLAQGTTYHITFLAPTAGSFQREIDSLLMLLNSSLSTYDSQSVISMVNRNDTRAVVDPYFSQVFEKSMEVSEKTEGLFDITVGPLINAYGFGPAKKLKVSTAVIDSLRNFVGYKKVKMDSGKIIKARPEISLDFNAIAQGYSVDVISDYLEAKGIKNYLVELGGEVKAKGSKAKDTLWTVGIDQPDEDPMFDRGIQGALTLKDLAMATSGNYKKFYEENGERYAHIINPTTGYTQKNDLLSVSVIARDCMTADAYATAFMVMGREKTIEFLSRNSELGLSVYLIFDDHGHWSTYVSPTLEKSIKDTRK